MTLLVHWTWQATLVVITVSLAMRMWPRANGATRHAIWWIALATVIALPLAWPAAVSPAATPVTPQVPPPDTVIVLPAVPAWVVQALGGAWFAWIALGIARLLADLRRLRELRRRSQPLPAKREAGLLRWSALPARRRRPELRVSASIAGACAVGLGRPAILLSRELVESLDDRALDQIVMHEQAHLDRWDDWGRLIQSLIEAVFGLHPVVRFIGGRLEVEREIACDERVVANTRHARDYARCLAEAAAIAARGRCRALTLVPGAVRSRGLLVTRVERLLAAPAGMPVAVRGGALACSLLLAALAAAGAGAVEPAVVFVDLLLRGPGPVSAPALDWAWADLAVPGPPASLAETATAGPRRPAPADVVAATSRPSAATGSAPSGPRPEGAAAPVPELRTVSLTGRELSAELAALAPFAEDGTHPAVAPPTAWSQLGAAGRGVGRVAGHTGAVVGGAAARGGAAVGQGFKRGGASLAGLFARAF